MLAGVSAWPPLNSWLAKKSPLVMSRNLWEFRALSAASASDEPPAAVDGLQFAAYSWRLAVGSWHECIETGAHVTGSIMIFVLLYYPVVL